jgi:hypothetical protein
MKTIILITFFLMLPIPFSGCDDTITVVDVDNKIIPDKDVSFADHIYPVLQVKCAISGCHESANPAGGLDLTGWANTTADPNIILPGEPDLSRLIWVVEGRAGFTHVDLIRPLTLNQIKGFRTWILEGAKNN